MVSNSCKKDDPESELAVGQSYQGGIIGYILTSNDIGYVKGETHGIIAAPSDQSAGIAWGCDNTTIGGTSRAIGSGNSNTLAIVAGCSNVETPASLCNNLVLANYSDWYLPSQDELLKLYWAKDKIGGFSGSNYWSSSEYDFHNSQAVSFSSPTIYADYKTLIYRVRAVRSF